MPIDYSKWDNFNFSSDDDQPSAGVTPLGKSDDAVPSRLQESVPHKVHAMATIKGQPVIRIENYVCYGCGMMKPVSECKKCGRCREAAYCSKQCQIASWPSHKASCVPCNHGDLFKQSKRALFEIVNLIVTFPDTPVFRRVSCCDPSACAVFAPSNLGRAQLDTLYNKGSGMSFVSLAQCMRSHHGDGLLIVYYSCIADCEDMVIDLATSYRGRSSSRVTSKSIPKIGFLLWPFQRLLDSDIEFPDWQHALAADLSVSTLGVAQIMKHATAEPDKLFAFCTIMAPSAEGLNDGAMEIRSCSVTNPCEIGVTSNKTAKTVKVSDESNRIAGMIMDDPDFSKCRQLLLQIRQSAGPPYAEGVIWIRNIDPRSSGPCIDGYSNGYEGYKNLVAAINPTSLKIAIQYHLSSPAVERHSILQIPIAFFDLKLHRSTLEDIWPDLYSEQRKPDGLADPDTVVGFFLTYLHKDSDQFILSQVHLKRPVHKI